MRALDEVGLGHRADAWPKTLSGGEAQRASLARALVREPDLLLLDEPFGALDALTRIKAQRLVADLWQQRGCAVLLVTHDVEEALLLADRALVMEDGRIAYETAVDLPRPRDICRPALHGAAGPSPRPAGRRGAGRHRGDPAARRMRRRRPGPTDARLRRTTGAARSRGDSQLPPRTRHENPREHPHGTLHE